MTCTCPGKVIEITPPYEHIHLDDSLNAGMLAIKVLGAPGTQGAAVTGTHGVGVNTPLAAEVADAVAGFAIEIHIANVGRLTTGL